MPNYETFAVGLNYNIQHGYDYLMSIEPYDDTVASGPASYRYFVLKVALHKTGYHLPSGIQINLYKPRKTYFESGVEKPLDKWGTYPLSENAIPEPMPNPEFERETPDSDFELVQWRDKYWELVPGSAFNDDIRDNSRGEGQSIDWPGLRHSHVFHIGLNYAEEHVSPSDIFLRVATTMESLAEKYLLCVNMYRGRRKIKWVLQFTINGKEVGNELLQAAYTPIAIVYCPPGQDMTNSLIESESHGTRMTFGSSFMSGSSESSSLSAGLSAGTKGKGRAGVDIGIEESATQSQSVTDSSSMTILITKTQETMITANNRTAVGRAYWGPLGDLFVILKDMLFYATQTFDEETGYALIPISDSPNCRKLILSTKELLMPDQGSVANEIDWVQRKKILKLNPFVIKDDSILDAVNAGTKPVEAAVNPNANPNTEHNPTRAVKVLNLDLGRGSEVNFYESRGIKLIKKETHAELYSTKLVKATGLGLQIGIPIIGFALGTSSSETLNIQYQTTLEMYQDISETKTAKCYLIRNQNDPYNGFMDVYYDTVFGTFLFSKIDYGRVPGVEPTPVFPPGIGVSVSGFIYNIAKQCIDAAIVYLNDGKNKTVASTITNDNGYYTFQPIDLKAGNYSISSSDATVKFRITQKDIKQGRININIETGKKLLNMSRTRYLDLMDIFEISLSEVHQLSKDLGKLQSEDDILRYLNLSVKEQREFKKLYKIIPIKKQNDKSKKIDKLKGQKK